MPTFSCLCSTFYDTYNLLFNQDLTLRSVSSFNNPQNSEMKFFEHAQPAMSNNEASVHEIYLFIYLFIYFYFLFFRIFSKPKKKKN
jgi:hypothetical protein